MKVFKIFKIFPSTVEASGHKTETEMSDSLSATARGAKSPSARESLAEIQEIQETSQEPQEAVEDQSATQEGLEAELPPAEDSLVHEEARGGA